ncbi:hypothetical protein TWF225_003066 [Orbilia oligospora]|uniref:Uncharacterized protein n=1 Tax=Orbilia oligospora TaxID=2813651 RepID=A0A7C8PRU4_ORBOL|nr:hypothetical protein TWF751_002780 [Orbilia oligospora]KAF3189329.1 hypothetical protein TWF225_003066 [Orbilia oligospora]KAF3244580.1 hypothetical protein TWF128_009684 [Orbilia oligospora]KAF3264898.1 hypothetical protein TWF217_003057 [Orbilia oligospora]KAF3294588.1 hypothetical protein TWF132_003085 [Orbilia oligospora]
MRATQALRMRPTAMLRMQQTRNVAMRQSPILRMAVPKEEQSGHTITQRLRRIKDVPVELIPLAVVIGAAIAAAGYSMVNKLMTDKTLRLSRQAAKH